MGNLIEDPVGLYTIPEALLSLTILTSVPPNFDSETMICLPLTSGT